MTMPNFMLVDEEYDSLTAYILSLRSPQAAAKAAAVARKSENKTSTRVEAGQDLALRQCSLCHVVSGDPRYRPFLGPPAPSFEEIANAPGTSAQSLRRFITTTHWDQTTIPAAMPSQNLVGSETDDVVAYILSLRKQR
jgi:mono/diheme cytochrome c family protein